MDTSIQNCKELIFIDYSIGMTVTVVRIANGL
jgi:hypothetical protein